MSIYDPDAPYTEYGWRLPNGHIQWGTLAFAGILAVDLVDNGKVDLGRFASVREEYFDGLAAAGGPVRPDQTRFGIVKRTRTVHWTETEEVL